MSEAPHVLYLVGIDFERDAWEGHAVRGVRAAWDALQEGLGGVGTYRAALNTVRGFAENPSQAVVIGQSDDEDVISAAVGQGLQWSDSVLTFAVNLESRELAVPEAPAEVEDGTDEGDDQFDGTFSPAAYKVALAFLAIAEGNPTIAYHRTWGMERASEDPVLWEEVRAVYESVFLSEDDSDGPQVVVVK